MRICEQCNEELEDSEFEGYSKICKECEDKNGNIVDEYEREDQESYIEHFSDN